MSEETPRSSADSSVVDEGFYCKISLDQDGAYQEEHITKYEAVLGSKEQFVEPKQSWFWSIIWGLFDAFAAGLITAVTVAFTFGFILPTSEIVLNEILGTGPILHFFDASRKNQALWIIAGMMSGFILGFTHAVVTETLAMYIGQFTGLTSFKDIRSPTTTVWGKAFRLVIDVLTEDFIVSVGFAGALALSAMIFFHASIAFVIVQFTSCMIGGIIVGGFLLPFQKLRKGSFSVKRKERVSSSERLSFFAIFESRIGALIRQKDYGLWVNGFVARVVAGVVFRPVAIITGALVERRLIEIRSPIRVVVSFTAFTGAATVLCGWFLTLRLSGWLMKKLGPRDPANAESVEKVTA